MEKLKTLKYYAIVAFACFAVGYAISDAQKPAVLEQHVEAIASHESNLSDKSVSNENGSTSSIKIKKGSKAADGSSTFEETTIDVSAYQKVKEEEIAEYKKSIEQLSSEIKQKNNLLRVGLAGVYDSGRKKIEYEAVIGYKIFTAVAGTNSSGNWRAGIGLGFSF